MTKKNTTMESLETKMSRALLRSGYVLESRIVHSLVQNGFFVEPNQRMTDPTTGKSREIDIVAELWDSIHEKSHRTRFCVSVHFVCEAKNNPYPIVLLTDLPYSPNTEEWDSLHESRTGIFKGEYLESSFFDSITDNQKIYTQYCSFKPKKNKKDTELIAWHPDDFHDDLEKIIIYSREKAELIEGLGDEYNRLFLYIPVVILAGDLYVAKPQDGTVTLTKTDFGLHMHFGMYEDIQRLSLVLFVTEKFYLTLFHQLIKFGQDIEKMAIHKFGLKDGDS